MLENGILTMCHQSDWHKAIGLVFSIKASSTALPVAIVAPEILRDKLEPYFDHFIPERPDLSGFRHKVYLDEYTPFKCTLFLDADMLVFRDPQELMDRWAGHAYMVRGHPETNGMSSFGLDRGKILDRLNKDAFACIDGAGHAYFENPAAHKIFHRAREILQDYENWAPNARVADEDIIGIVLTELDIIPERNKQIVGFPKAIKRTTKKMNAVTGDCEYIDLEGDSLAPLIMHFPRNMAPMRYHKQLSLLNKKFQGPKDIPWLKLGTQEWLHYSFYWSIKRRLKALLGKK